MRRALNQADLCPTAHRGGDILRDISRRLLIQRTREKQRWHAAARKPFFGYPFELFSKRQTIRRTKQHFLQRTDALPCILQRFPGDLGNIQRRAFCRDSSYRLRKSLFLRKQNGKRPLLVACDIYRPAAIQQLEVVGKQLDIPVFQMGQENPVTIAQAAIEHAKKHGNDMVFLDTAGRLHVDEALMAELQSIKEAVHPSEILLVVDAMIGQDAVNAAKAFDEALDIDGVVLTKLDGDARGGAALSIKAVTGKPIKFVGMGEKLDNIEVFHPDRMASRILGMGDVLTLIEKAEQQFDQQKAQELAEKLKKNRFTLQDYYDQLVQVKGMGSVEELLGMMPGINAKALEGATINEKALTRTEAIILSMTPQERENPSILNSSRKKRIAAGCGLQVVDVNRLLKEFGMMQQMTKQMSKLTGKRRKGKFGKLPGGFPGLPFK